MQRKPKEAAFYKYKKVGNYWLITVKPKATILAPSQFRSHGNAVGSLLNIKFY